MKTRRITSAKVSLMQLMEAGSMCAWEGCRETYKGDIPRDWRWLGVWWAPAGVTDLLEIAGRYTVDRDAVLCPGHARLLDTYLKDIGNRLKETQGRA